MDTLTAGSLFSGIGGLDLAAALAGFDIRFHVEFDDYRRKVLDKHAPTYWPNARSFKDVREVSASDLAPTGGRLDVLFGGFPCQDVSLAGNRAGLGEGTRSGLWSEFRRLIGDLRPRSVVVENVPGLLTLGGSTVIADFAQMGYVGRWGVISAADATAPHLRERVFIVAYARQDRQPGADIESGEGANPSEWQHSTGHSEHHRIGEYLANPARSGGAFHRNPRREALAVAQTQRRQRLPHIGRSAGEIFQWRHVDGRAGQQWRPAHAQPGMGRNHDGFPARLDGFVGFPNHQYQPQYGYEPPRTVAPYSIPNRVARVEACGDAVVPWQAFPIFYFLAQRLMEQQP